MDCRSKPGTCFRRAPLLARRCGSRANSVVANVCRTTQFFATISATGLSCLSARQGRHRPGPRAAAHRTEQAGCRRIYEEKVSGARRDRPQLARLLDQVREQDVVVIYRLDRLARSTRDLLEIAEQLREAGAGLRSLGEPWADTTSPAGRMVLTIFAGIAEFERALIQERTGAGRALPNGAVCASAGPPSWGQSRSPWPSACSRRAPPPARWRACSKSTAPPSIGPSQPYPQSPSETPEGQGTCYSSENGRFQDCNVAALAAFVTLPSRASRPVGLERHASRPSSQVRLMPLTIALAGRRIDAVAAGAPRFPLANAALVRERLRALFVRRRSGHVGVLRRLRRRSRCA